MNDLALKRLTAAGWTPDRKVDCSEIECLYREQNLILPDVLRIFFESFAYLDTYKMTDNDNDWHCIDPSTVLFRYKDRVYTLKDGSKRSGFDGFKKYELQPFFERHGIIGELYPIGTSCRGCINIYYHENGKFYMYGEGPTTEIGSNVDEMLNFLFGDAPASAELPG